VGGGAAFFFVGGGAAFFLVGGGAAAFFLGSSASAILNHKHKVELGEVGWLVQTVKTTTTKGQGGLDIRKNEDIHEMDKGNFPRQSLHRLEQCH
jgi:hypothetical protein